MYLPSAFAGNDLAALDALLERDAFITLVTVDGEGLPFASHLPVLHAREGGTVRLRGHWARANPQAGHAGPALAIVHGPHHYVSPGWYPDKAEAARVPTWNYAVAHLRGSLRLLHGEDELAAIVAALGERHETAFGGDWRYDHADPAERRQLRGIVGFELEVSTIALKLKLSQNHPAANVQGVIDGLRAQSGPQAGDIAALMQAQRTPA